MALLYDDDSERETEPHKEPENDEEDSNIYAPPKVLCRRCEMRMMNFGREETDAEEDALYNVQAPEKRARGEWHMRDSKTRHW